MKNNRKKQIERSQETKQNEQIVEEVEQKNHKEEQLIKPEELERPKVSVLDDYEELLLNQRDLKIKAGPTFATTHNVSENEAPSVGIDIDKKAKFVKGKSNEAGQNLKEAISISNTDSISYKIESKEEATWENEMQTSYPVITNISRRDSGVAPGFHTHEQDKVWSEGKDSVMLHPELRGELIIENSAEQGAVSSEIDELNL